MVCNGITDAGKGKILKNKNKNNSPCFLLEVLNYLISTVAPHFKFLLMSSVSGFFTPSFTAFPASTDLSAFKPGPGNFHGQL